MLAQDLFSFFTFFVQLTLLVFGVLFLIILSLALSTLQCVHSYPNKCDLPLSLTLIWHSNRHHMKNNIRFKGNINNASVIIFLIGSQLNKNSQPCYFAWKNLQWGFCDVGCSCSFILLLFFIHFCSSFVAVLHFHCFSTSSLALP